MPRIIFEMDDCLMIIEADLGDEWKVTIFDTGFGSPDRNLAVADVLQMRPRANIEGVTTVQAGSLVALAMGIGEVETGGNQKHEDAVNYLYGSIEEIVGKLPRNLRPIP